METIVKVDQAHFVSATEVVLQFISTEDGCTTSHCLTYKAEGSTISREHLCRHSADGITWEDPTSSTGQKPLEKNDFLTWIIRDLIGSFDKTEELVNAIYAAFEEAVLKSL